MQGRTGRGREGYSGFRVRGSGADRAGEGDQGQTEQGRLFKVQGSGADRAGEAIQGLGIRGRQGRGRYSGFRDQVQAGL